MESILEGIRCMPSRRSLKFIPDPHARHFLAFDAAISKEDRFILLMELFVFYKQLVDPDVVMGYVPADYLPEDLVEVRVITDPRHPAYRQSGLFAKRTIPNNTIVTPYSGLIEVFCTSCNSRTYTMGFGKINDDYALDAEFVGNYGRFANDPRSIEGSSANLTAESRFNSRGEPFTALVARRQINEGEEILMAYGKAHSLSPSPWVNPRGELLLQYRCGGIIPFPNLVPPGTNQGEGVGPFSDEKQVKTADGNADAPFSNETAPAALPVSADPIAAYHITWECTQCGMWNICSDSSMLKIDYCSHCRTPKLAGAKLVSVLSTPPITAESLATEGGIPVPSGMEAIFPTERNSPHSHADASSLSTHQLSMLSPQASAAGSFPSNPKKRKRASSDHASASTALSNPLGGNSQLNSPSSVCVSPTNHTPGYSSVRVDWPMNIPFLPWQVWDNAISMVAISRYSRFVPHEHVFLYNVNSHEEHEEGEDDDTLGGESSSPKEHLIRMHGRGMTSSSGKHAQQTAASCIAASGGIKMFQTPKRRGRPPHKSSVGINADYRIRQESVVATTGGDSNDSLLQHSGDRDASRPLAKTLEKHHLTFSHSLLQAHPSIECFTLLHTRRPSRRRGCDDTIDPWPTPLEATRRLLLSMTRRQFSGTAFHPGDLVGYMGGSICPINDTRCRPGNSPLAIPMKYLIPRRWRRARGGRTTAPLHEAPNRGEDAVTAASAAVDEEARDFLARLSSLCLVVTNDMMFCPCLALADAEDDAVEPQTAVEGGGEGLSPAPDPALMEEADALLKSCNIAPVLTLDALGSPFVGLVATRSITAFEPLMVRTQ
ncbi:unnamed protein product [Phytomonas sp. EM1]|nr:unnamed protein product [Phytomonas sp. EM1]|eukprot:CCW62084.1 unnamed protein product [Phytomonas sp. isolate EM1]